MSEHPYWHTLWHGHVYVMDDIGRLIRATDDKGER